jgi:chromosomal replication initiator protein
MMNEKTVTTDPNYKKSTRETPSSQQKDDKKRSIKRFSSPLIEEKTFENFVVDDSNRFPYLAAEAVATGEGRRYNPLFLYGPVGVGKSHLLQAIANKMKEQDPDLNIVYSSTEKFTDVLINYLSIDNIQDFRKLYRDIDVILMDDIQMLSGREATQKEFFHMFNHLYNSSKQIVLCSDRPPSDIIELETRLRSRFEGGLIIDIQVPTFEGRRQILLNLSHRDGFSISSEVLDYLAFYLDTSVRELEGGFNRVTAYASLMKEPITVNLVRKVLEGILQKREILRKDETELKEEHKRYSEKATENDHSSSPYEDLDLEEETDMIEKELLFELKKGQ